MRRAWWTEEQIEDAFVAMCEPTVNRRGWELARQVKLNRKSIADVIITTPKRVHIVELKVTADSAAWAQLRRYAEHFLEWDESERDIQCHIVARFFDFSTYLPALLERQKLWRAFDDNGALKFTREHHPMTEDQHLDHWRKHG